MLAEAAKIDPEANCEIYIDQMYAYRENGKTFIRVSVATKNDMLDSWITDVGFRNRTNNDQWVNTKLVNAYNTDNYFATSIIVDDGTDLTVTGSFYVKTKKGSTYWTKPINGGHFEFTAETAELLLITGTLPTQEDSLRQFNPRVCR
jgi:hypothetical protein